MPTRGTRLSPFSLGKSRENALPSVPLCSLFFRSFATDFGHLMGTRFELLPIEPHDLRKSIPASRGGAQKLAIAAQIPINLGTNRPSRDGTVES